MAAVGYARRGLPVFPLAPGSKAPAIPKQEGGQGYKDATTDPVQIEAWWRRWPDAGIGFPPGRAGLLVIDVDGLDAEAHAGALGLFAEPTLEAVSGRADGGRHLYLRHPGGQIGNVRLGHARVEVRADAGYVRLPPSPHPETGRPCRWVAREVAPIPLPPQALALLRQLAAAANRPTPAGAPAGGVIPEGQRNATLARIAGAMRRHGCGEATILTALVAENGERCVPPLPAPEVARIASSVSRYEPAPMHELNESNVPRRGSRDLIRNTSGDADETVHAHARRKGVPWP